MRKFLITAFIVLAAVSVLSAEGTGYTAAEAAKIAGSGWRYLAHIAIGLGAAGCGVGQGKAVASACEGIARNPQVTGNIRTTMIIGLAMIEAMVIYALVAAFAIGNI